MNKGLISIAALVVVLLLSISCGKATQCRTCQIRIEDYFGKIAYRSGLNAIEFSEARIWKPSDATTAELVDIRIPTPDYLNFNLEASSLTDAAYETQVTVLYVDRSLILEKEFSPENIQGISRFSVSGNYFKHFFYQRKEGKYLQLNEASGNATLITTNTLNLIANKIVFSGGVKKSIVVISNSDFKGLAGKSNKDILQKRIRKL